MDPRPLEGEQGRIHSIALGSTLAPVSGVFDFAEQSAGDVVDETADGNLLWNPRMGAQLLQLVADIFFNVLEGVEKKPVKERRYRCDSEFGCANPVRWYASTRNRCG